jgi:hypothetical protein
MTLTLPPALLFGYWGIAPLPWLIILSSAHRNHAALIAHEQCHQSQQRRDGTLRFWWRYLTSREWRQTYEVEAYKAWLNVNPANIYSVARMLATRYKLNLTLAQAVQLLEAE